ncbi:hypothetical protein D3C76_1524770 [compost metagenome]
MGDNLLPAADPAEHAARVVALEALFRNLVAVLAAAQGHNVKTVANLYPFHRVDAHHCMGDVGVEAVKDRLTPARRYTVSYDRDFGADGVALFFQAAHQFVQGLQL